MHVRQTRWTFFIYGFIVSDLLHVYIKSTRTLKWYIQCNKRSWESVNYSEIDLKLV